MSAPSTASEFEVVVSTPCRSRSSAARVSLRLVATMSVEPELTRPASSASPMRPVPRIAIRLMLRGRYRAARMQPERAQLRRRELGEIVGGRRSVQVLGDGGADPPDDRLLEPPRALRLDQLAAERSQQRLRDRADARRPQTAERT